MSAARSKKCFVIDTNVILHDAGCIHNFQEHDVVIPITVLEELDHFKRGNQVINLNAREFVRTLDQMTGAQLFEKGISLGKGRGMLRIELTRQLSSEIQAIFDEVTPDHRILSVAMELQKSGKNRNVILISKDVNLRMKAKALGLISEDYTSDRIASVEELYRGKALVEPFDVSLINSLYEPPYSNDSKALFEVPETEPFPNKYYILRNESRSALARLSNDMSLLQRVDTQEVYGITPRNAEQTFAIDSLIDPSISLVTLTGKAGSGKTLLALAAALENRRQYRQIYLARPVVPLSNRDIGYLPGDVENKLDPYMQPLWDNLKVIQNQFKEKDDRYQKITDLIQENKLTIAPLAYIRGRSLQKIFFIIDEAQNLTPHEIKTIITRAGEGTKLVFTGDIYQIDHPYLDSQSNGLSYLIEKMKGQKLYAQVNLEKGERSELSELAANLL
jgi:PhoH-like ATPase